MPVGGTTMSTLPNEFVVPLAKDGQVSNTWPQYLGWPLTIKPFGHGSFFTNTLTRAFAIGMSVTFGLGESSSMWWAVKFTFNVAAGVTVIDTVATFEFRDPSYALNVKLSLP